MEEDVRLVVLEHLGHKLGVHVLDIDLLEVLVQHHDGLIQFFLHQSQPCCYYVNYFDETDNIDDDAREQLALLMLVWAFLYARSIHV